MMTRMMCAVGAALVLVAAAGAQDPLKARFEKVVEAAQQGGAALRGDALFDACLAAAARPTGLDQDGLLALAAFFDEEGYLARVPVHGRRFEGLASAEARAAFRERARAATLRGRHDLVKHFTMGAALALLTGEDLAKGAAVEKEMQDARSKDAGKGYGLSFVDLLASEAGIACAKTAKRDPARLRGARATAAALMPEIDGFEEGIGEADLEERFGGPGDPRFERELARVRKRIASCPAHEAPREGEPAKEGGH